MTIQLLPGPFSCTDSPENCLGVISRADWLRLRECQADAPGSTAPLPVTCSFQAKYRAASGGEKTLCTLPSGACPVQSRMANTNGLRLVTCSEPNCVLVDWQVVGVEPLPADEPHHFVIVDPELGSSDPTLPDLSRRMIDSQILHAGVVDREMIPIGVVSRADLLTVVLWAEPER
jgi:hypothetical protein